MKESTVRGTLRKRTAWFRALIPGGLLCILLCCSSKGFAQYVNEYIDVSVGSDGTIYATGTTDAGWMSDHSAWVETLIRSPSGRAAGGSASVDSGGYVSADASLAFESTDLGEYVASATGDGNCYVYGDLGKAYAGLGIYESIWTGKLNASTSTTCYYSQYCPDNTAPTCQPSPSALDLSFGYSCPSYMEEFDLYVVIGSSKQCLGLGLKYGSPAPLDCQ